MRSKTNQEWAAMVSGQIFARLDERCGFDEWWARIGAALRIEIRNEIADLLIDNMDALPPQTVTASVQVGTVEAGASVVGVQL